MSERGLVIGDDGYAHYADELAWPELVSGTDRFQVLGEMFRGGTPHFDQFGPQLVGGMNPQTAYQILGEMVQKSPAFAQYAAKRAAAASAVVRKIPRLPAQDWQLDFGPVSGAAGTTTTLSVQPQCLFRCEKIFATDTATSTGPSTASPSGTGTRIGQIVIGQRNQRPATTTTLTLFFTQLALGNGIKLNTCKEALSISITVSFVNACTFDLTMWGKALP